MADPTVYGSEYGVDIPNNPNVNIAPPIDYSKISTPDVRYLINADSGGANDPVGNTNFNYTIPGAYTGTGLTNTNGTILNTVQNLFTDKNGNLNLQALGAVGGGLAGLLGAMDKTTTPTGYQGGIPALTATRNMIQAPPTREQGYRPGAGGIDYGGDVTYTRTPGVDPWANLYGGSGTSANANLAGLLGGIGGASKGIAANLPGVTSPTVKPPVVTPPTVKPPVVTPPAVNTTVANPADDWRKGLTSQQVVSQINQWLLDHPYASQDQIAAAMKQFNVKDSELQGALGQSNFSDAMKYALTHGSGFAEVNANIQNWIAKNPYATNAQIQEIMRASGVSDADIARGLNAMTTSAGKEYAIVNDMGLDQYYQNILNYQAANHTPEEIAQAMETYGVSQADLNTAQKYAAETNYKPTAPVVAAPVVTTPVVAETPVQQASTGLDTKNDIYQYFADPSIQAALAAGDTRGIAETMQSLGWSPAEVAAATGSNPAEVQAAYDAALRNTDYSYMQAAEGGYLGYAGGGEIAMAKGRYLQGGTDGMADRVPAQIGTNQPAALSHGEFVIPADVVSHMGNGNSDAGAKKLYQMMDKIRMARTGTKKQGKKINPDKFMPGGLAQAYAAGGAVKRFEAGGGISGVGTAANAGVTGTESALSNWAGPYVTNMLGQGQALANAPYQAYMGPLTAGESPLQSQAFGTAAGLTTPTSIGDAATQAGNISTAAQGLKYTPNTSSFDTTQAQAYMNPYLEASLKPQLEEARRQSLITQQGNAAKMTQAGAFGGGRQAILDAETQRNLGTNLANITGTGYNTAYNNAQAQFNADQQRKMAENQYGAGYGLQGLQTGLQAAQAQGSLGAQQNQMGLANLQQQLAAGQQQRGIESEGIAADKAQFEEARANPYKMVQFQQSLLQGLPTSAQNINMAQPSTLQQILAGAGGVAGLFPTTSTTGAQDLAAALKKLGIG